MRLYGFMRVPRLVSVDHFIIIINIIIYLLKINIKVDNNSASEQDKQAHSDLTSRCNNT